jgi:putative glutamine amidotransferase
MPTLGICRGLQVLNVALGGSLVEHLPDEVGEVITHRNPPPGHAQISSYALHPLRVDEASRLAAILGMTQVEPASWHHQAVRRVADGLQVVARADDGTVEAAELVDHPWLLAVQWHPEITAADDPAQQRLFDAFVAAARESAGRRH